MARKKDKEKAIQMRLEGKTYSEIKNELGVSKSTLSGWLHNYPLSPERLKQVRENNPRRIENFRKTMRRKREQNIEEAYKKSAREVGRMTKRELLIAGYFLYWAEGSKTTRNEASLSNTDPAMIRFFIEWLELLGISRKRLKAHLHLYSDMNAEKEIRYWVKQTGLKRSQFTKPYVKKSQLSSVRFSSGGFGHGTCNIRFGNREFADRVHMTVRYIRSEYGDLTPLQEIK